MRLHTFTTGRLQGVVLGAGQPGYGHFAHKLTIRNLSAAASKVIFDAAFPVNAR
jgi:hypothetical protein